MLCKDPYSSGKLDTRQKHHLSDPANRLRQVRARRFQCRYTWGHRARPPTCKRLRPQPLRSVFVVSLSIYLFPCSIRTFSPLALSPAFTGVGVVESKGQHFVYQDHIGPHMMLGGSGGQLAFLLVLGSFDYPNYDGRPSP